MKGIQLWYGKSCTFDRTIVSLNNVRQVRQIFPLFTCLYYGMQYFSNNNQDIHIAQFEKKNFLQNIFLKLFKAYFLQKRLYFRTKKKFKNNFYFMKVFVKLSLLTKNLVLEKYPPSMFVNSFVCNTLQLFNQSIYFCFPC